MEPDNKQSDNSVLVSTPKASTANVEIKANETPAKKITRVRNPFDQAILERLHLPIIGSPSLFQIPPQTPQMSSTLFEWTIDDVSSLQPVHLEAHETQFQDSPDPDVEAKAQSAISSYFKEQVIVPSPIDCPLRKNRIILSEMNGATPIAKNKNQSRHHSLAAHNAQTQTELSLPPILPPELEKMLSLYMLPNCQQTANSTANSFYSDELQLSVKRTTLQMSTDAAAKDVSLRRKLFDKHNIVLLDNSPTNFHMSSSPSQSAMRRDRTIAGTLGESLDRSSICSLSPISARESFSSPDRACSMKRKAPDFMDKLQDVEDLSPIERSSPKSRRMSVEAKQRKTSFLHKYRTSPDLSDLSAISHGDNANQMCDASVLQVREEQENLSLNNQVLALKMTNNGFSQEEEEEVEEQEEEEEDIRDISTSSNQSCVSEFSNTPRRSKRGRTRSKNLSRSFNAFLEDDDDVDLAVEHNDSLSQSLKINNAQNLPVDLKTETALVGAKQPKEILSYVTGCDSGFNENCSRVKENFAIIDDDVLMN